MQAVRVLTDRIAKTTFVDDDVVELESTAAVVQSTTSSLRSISTAKPAVVTKLEQAASRSTSVAPSSRQKRVKAPAVSSTPSVPSNKSTGGRKSGTGRKRAASNGTKHASPLESPSEMASGRPRVDSVSEEVNAKLAESQSSPQQRLSVAAEPSSVRSKRTRSEESSDAVAVHHSKRSRKSSTE